MPWRSAKDDASERTETRGSVVERRMRSRIHVAIVVTLTGSCGRLAFTKSVSLGRRCTMAVCRGQTVKARTGHKSGIECGWTQKGLMMRRWFRVSSVPQRENVNTEKVVHRCGCEGRSCEGLMVEGRQPSKEECELLLQRAMGRWRMSLSVEDVAGWARDPW